MPIDFSRLNPFRSHSVPVVHAPSAKELQNLANDVSASYLSRTLHIREVPKMMQKVVDEVMKRYPGLEFDELLSACQTIVSLVLDQTTTPLLDAITDPLFKAMAPSFCSVLILERLELPKGTAKRGEPTEVELKQWMQGVQHDMRDPSDWESISKTVTSAIHFIWQYEELSSNEKVSFARELLFALVDQAQFDHPQMIKLFIEGLLEAYSVSMHKSGSV